MKPKLIEELKGKVVEVEILPPDFPTLFPFSF